MKILIVDDDARWLKKLKGMLEGLGYTVITASDHKSGLKSLEENVPDLVITDLFMGKPRSGIYLLWDVKEFNQKTRVILMSEDFPSGVRDEALSAGAETTLTKPFSLEELEKVLAG